MRMKLAAAAAVIGIVALTTLSAGAGSDIQASSTEGPSGTVVSIAHASDALKGGAEHCTAQVTLKMVAQANVQTADLSGGVPFVPPSGTFVVPSAPPGDYSVVVVCDGTAGMDSFPFRVTVAAITASPNFAG